MTYDFKPVELKDRPHLTGYKPLTRFISCEYNFANLAVWGELYDISWTRFRGVPLIHIGKDDCFLFPHAKGISSKLLMELSDSLRVSGFSGKFVQVPKGFVEANPNLGDCFDIVPDENFADYIYSAESLATLAGGKLSKKRNLIAQFKRANGECVSHPLEKRFFARCMEMMDRETKVSSKTATEERMAVSRAFELFDEIGLSGIIVAVSDVVVGFAITSRHIDGTCCVHFEKASRDVKGAAQMVNMKTAEFLARNCDYINREQDLGLQGLRQAKRSYGPVVRLVNYELTPLV